MTAIDYTSLFDNTRVELPHATVSGTPEEPLIIFMLGGAVYEACLFDEEAGAVSLYNAATGELVLSTHIGGFAAFLFVNGCDPDKAAEILSKLGANPAKD